MCCHRFNSKFARYSVGPRPAVSSSAGSATLMCWAPLSVREHVFARAAMMGGNGCCWLSLLARASTERAAAAAATKAAPALRPRVLKDATGGRPPRFLFPIHSNSWTALNNRCINSKPQTPNPTSRSIEAYSCECHASSRSK